MRFVSCTAALAFIGSAGTGAMDGRIDEPGQNDEGWETVQPGGDTGCGFGTPYSFWFREGDAQEVLIYLQGGGACWTVATCHPDLGIRFDSAIDSSDYRQRRSGIFDRRDQRNPFRTFTALFVPYCTGDLHFGTRQVTYTQAVAEGSAQVTVRHLGHHNVEAALRFLATRISAPRLIVVTGGSAGAIASPLYAAELARRFPAAVVKQIGDGAGALRVRDAGSLLRNWGAESVTHLDDVPRGADDSFTWLYLDAARRSPLVGYGQINATLDERIDAYLRSFGYNPALLPQFITETYAELRSAGICFAGITTAERQHTVLWRPEFFTSRALSGDPLVEAVRREILDRPCS